MSTTFIVLSVFAFVGMLCVIIFYAHKVDTLTTDNGILKRRNETLEELFSKEEEHATTAPPKYWSGVEILQTFAQSHQVQLEPDENFNDKDWVLYFFTYQGGRFYSYVSKHSDEVLIRYAHFDDMAYSDAAHIRIMRLCNEYTADRRYVKLVYTLENNDMGEQEIHLHLNYDLLGVSQDGIEFLLNNNFIFVHEIGKIVDDFRKEVEELQPSTNKPKTEADFQAMAIRMAMSRNNQ